ncbi:hypothetical protein E2562_017453 [Oryza meyeriana var. granulata]|uniref:Uncharacterized protein n=1 Tax=Oryza meyeriana var. granulata TaxID=110450 RepID=A0A6G1DXS8_9ORYZ|nr:hypothetical protein E2562_017453 [Oryza meyeriana var. granulata]
MRANRALDKREMEKAGGIPLVEETTTTNMEKSTDRKPSQPPEKHRLQPTSKPKPSIEDLANIEEIQRRRAVITGRAVRVKSQLNWMWFAIGFRSYCNLVDDAKLYSTNSMGAAKLIGWKNGKSNLLVDPSEIGCFREGTANSS